MRLYQRLLESFDRFANRPAISFLDAADSVQSVTYRELRRNVTCLANFMMEKNANPNDYIITYMIKTPQLIESIFAAFLIGAVPCCLNQKLRYYNVAKIAEKIDAKFILINNPTLINILKEKQNKNATKRFILCERSKKMRSKSALYKKALSSMHLLEYRSGERPEKDIRNFGDNGFGGRGYCLFTSGSTGDPKGVLISRDDLYQRACTELTDYALTESDVLLSLLPLSFDVGLNQMLSCFFAGANLVILNSWLPRDILTAIKVHGITGISSVPSIWMDMLSYPKSHELLRDIRSLRYITVSGGDLSCGNLRLLKSYFKGVDIYKTYGQTETFRSGILKPDDFDKKMASVGRPPKGTNVYIMNNERKIVPPSTEGEIVHQGVGTMIKYAGDEDGTNAKIQNIKLGFGNNLEQRRVVLTGDVGKIDEDGFLYISGRIDGMIKTSGNRVYPKEVENVIIENGHVLNTAVFGIKEPKIGQAIYAEVVPKDSIQKSELMAFLRKRLPSYMLPSRNVLRTKHPYDG